MQLFSPHARFKKRQLRKQFWGNILIFTGGCLSHLTVVARMVRGPLLHLELRDYMHLPMLSLDRAPTSTESVRASLIWASLCVCFVLCLVIACELCVVLRVALGFECRFVCSCVSALCVPSCLALCFHACSTARCTLRCLSADLFFVLMRFCCVL